MLCCICIISCVYLITNCICSSRRNTVNLYFVYIQFNKAKTTIHIVYILIILTKLRLTVTINQGEYYENYLSYRKETCLGIYFFYLQITLVNFFLSFQ